MQGTHGGIVSTITSNFVLALYALLLVLLTSCGKSSGLNENSETSGMLSAPLSSVLGALVVDTSTLVVDIVVDGESQTCVNLIVDQQSNSYSCVITLPPGQHTLSLVYSVKDSTYGTLQVTTTSGINVGVIAGKNSPADFSSATLTYNDSDGDGITDLNELIEGSNPTVSSFYVGGTISGLSGSNGELQLNGSSTLGLSSDGPFIMMPALATGSSYSVVVSTQPSMPRQNCIVSNGTGTISDITIGDVVVTCVDIQNVAPIVSNVVISDVNGGNAVEGDVLTGNYAYDDLDGDLEATSSIRWLRDGVVINGATSSSYTLLSVDIPTRMTYEVTPIAATGVVSGIATTSVELVTGTAPVMSGFARYLDINLNGVNDANDKIIIPFDQVVSLNTSNISALKLPVLGDTFGTGATVTAGPAANEITILTGGSASFKTRQNYSNMSLAVNSASGVDVATVLLVDAIEGASGIDAVSSTTIDLIPAFVDGLSLQSFGANSSTFAALGDLDGDGDLDITVANQGQSNRVFLNNGAGTYSDTNQNLGSNSSEFIALGDVDRDGDLDMVVANSANQPNRVYTNNGQGIFTDSGQNLGATGDASTAIALGDLDGDGDLDMVVANFAQANVVYINDGLGVFTDSGQTLGSYTSTAVVLGDVDGDGDLDMVVANSSQSSRANRVYTNNGLGVFTDSGQFLGAYDSQSLALGDIDGDGDLDLVVANASNLVNLADRVYTNDGAGIFTDSGQLLDTNNSSGVALGDVDADGDLDMVIANRLGLGSDGTNRIFINDGSGRYSDSGQALGTNSSDSVVLGDVDGDGDLDLVVSNGFGTDDANRIYLNSLSGTWGTASLVESGQSLGSSNSSSSALGDVDGDGDLDLVVANSSIQANRVYRNDGSGMLTDTGQSLGSNNSSSVVLGDVDDDGDLDMVVANGSSQANRMYRNDGTGGFSDSGQSLGVGSSTDVALADLDGDGDLDLVVVNRSAPVYQLYLNDGSGSFVDSGRSLSAKGGGSRIALGDLNGDGSLDMVFANRSIEQSRAYINNGLGNFTDVGQSFGTGFSQSVVLGDLDGDGDLDMVIANEPGAAVLYTKNSTGTFDSGQILVGTAGYSVKFADFDGDGDLDMALGTQIHINSGSGVFTDSGQSLGTGNREIELGDLDRDGDVDIVMSVIGAANQVYFNQ